MHHHGNNAEPTKIQRNHFSGSGQHDCTNTGFCDDHMILEVARLITSKCNCLPIVLMLIMGLSLSTSLPDEVPLQV